MWQIKISSETTTPAGKPKRWTRCIDGSALLIQTRGNFDDLDYDYYAVFGNAAVQS